MRLPYKFRFVNWIQSLIQPVYRWTLIYITNELQRIEDELND